MRLTVRTFNEKDVAARVQWINDKRVNDTMFFDLPATEQRTLQWYEANKGNTNRADYTFVGENGEHIGMGGFTEIDRKNSHAEFYIMVNPEAQGKGYGKRITRWLFSEAFTTLSLRRVYLYTNDDNARAYKLYEDCGCTHEGTLREHKIKDGIYLNRRYYGILRSDWQKLAWSVNPNPDFC